MRISPTLGHGPHRRRRVGSAPAAIVGLLATCVVSIASAQTLPRGATGSVPAATVTRETWRVAGRVIAADGSGAGIRRAIVKISGGGLPAARSVISDEAGRFAFERVPEGRITIVVSKPAYLTSAFGAPAPGRAGTPVAVGPGHAPTDIEIPLPRGAVITGTVRDQRGDPVPGAQVDVVRARDVALPPLTSPAPAANVTTDDQGVYRAYGLAPGTYAVAVAIRDMDGAQIGMPPDTEVDRALAELERSAPRLGAATPPNNGSVPATPAFDAFSLVPIFYPGTTSAADAGSLTLAAGEERNGVDVVLRLVRAVAVEGTVFSADGPMPPVLIELRSNAASPFPMVVRPTLSVAPGADGHFKYIGVTPGDYTLTVRSATPTPDSRGRFELEKYGSGDPLPPGLNPDAVTWARADFAVSESDVSGLALTLQPAWHLAGRIAFDASTAPPPVDLTGLSVTMPYAARGTGGVSISTTGAMSGRLAVPAAHVARDGTFDLAPVLPETYGLASVAPGRDTWWLRSAMVNGQDVLDRPLEMTGNVDGAVLTFTDRHTALTGVLQTPAGAPAAEYFVVVFTTDRSLWRPQARRLLSTRPATDGQFTIKDLPPGEYYLAALTDLDPREWQTPEFLDQLVPAALTIAVGEGEQKRQDIRLK